MNEAITQNHQLAHTYYSPETIYKHMPTLVNDMLATFDRQRWGLPVGWQRNQELQEVIATYRQIARPAKD